jgi:hypothetical protein
MKVNIKTLAVEMELKNKGMELDVHWPSGGKRGRVKISRSGIYWLRSGKHSTRRRAWRRISWDNFIEIMATNWTPQAAVRAAKNS